MIERSCSYYAIEPIASPRDVGISDSDSHLARMKRTVSGGEATQSSDAEHVSNSHNDRHSVVIAREDRLGEAERHGEDDLQRFSLGDGLHPWGPLHLIHAFEHIPEHPTQRLARIISVPQQRDARQGAQERRARQQRVGAEPVARLDLVAHYMKLDRRIEHEERQRHQADRRQRCRFDDVVRVDLVARALCRARRVHAQAATTIGVVLPVPRGFCRLHEGFVDLG